MSDVIAKWDGSGLPPVGVECHVKCKFNIGEFVKCRIVAHDDHFSGGPVAVFMIRDYDGYDQYYSCGTASLFRPIKTPEEIEREELEQLAYDFYREFCRSDTAKRLSGRWVVGCSFDQFVSRAGCDDGGHWLAMAKAAKKHFESKMNSRGGE